MEVGGQQLGVNFYEIFVELPMMTDEPLVRPYGNYQTIGDVAGTTIAWPKNLVSKNIMYIHFL